MNRVFLAWLGFFSFTCGALAEPITIEEYFSKVRSNHPFFKKESLAVDVEKKSQQRFSGDEDWVISATPSYVHSEPAREGGFTPEQVDRMSLEMGVSRHFWSTGATVSLNYGYIYSDQKVEDIILPLQSGPITMPSEGGAFHENSLSLTWRQPLLKNRGGVLSKLAHDLQGYNVEATALMAGENSESFLENSGMLFIDWALLHEQRKISTTRLGLAEKELERTKEKRKHNLVDEVDVIRAQDAVIATLQGIWNLDTAISGLEAELRTIAFIAAEAKVEPQFDLYAMADDILELKASQARMERSSRLLKIFDVRMRQVDQQKAGAKESEKPRLDAILQGGVKSGAESFGDSSSADKPQAMAALVFSYPLGSRAAKAGMARAALERERLTEERNNLRVKLHSALQSLLARMNSLERAMTLDRQRISTAEKKTNAEQKRYEQGRVELTFVIQSQDSEQAARLAYAQSGANYQKLALAYRSLMDMLAPAAAGDRE